MEGVIEGMDAGYEIELSTPLFDLPARRVEVLENLYHSLKSDYGISPSDMQAIDGAALSDAKIRIVLLGGVVAVEVMADRMVVEFNQLEGSRDFSTYESCIVNCERAIRGIYPELCTEMTSMFCSANIKISGETTGKKLLGDSVGCGGGIDLSDFGTVEQFPSASAAIHNNQKNWFSTFRADFMSPSKSSLVAFCRISYTDSKIPYKLPDRLFQFKNRVEEFEKLFRVLLQKIDVNVKNFILGNR